MAYKPLEMGDITVPLPLVQGGMGVGVSLSGLAGAVACEGGLGVISAAQIGYQEPDFYENTVAANLRALKKHLARAKEIACGGIIGVNIMTASNHYEDYVKCCAENGADLIVSGAGLPVALPEIVSGSKTKIAPIVSSLKAAKVLLKMWDKRYGKTADMIVIEGPLAGGHLGFKPEELEEKSAPFSFDSEIQAILEFIRTQEEKFKKKIPVIFGGGISDNRKVQHLMDDLGVDGVQVASPFVATTACDAAPAYKQAYINATKEDICIIKSPVGMPGRAIENNFIRRTRIKNEPIKKCLSCLGRCDRQKIPYCITEALINAVKGDTENGLIFCGANIGSIKEISTVKAVIDSLMG